MRELSRPPLPPLVDRAEEVARIAEALDAAERGEGQLLLLRGEAGCGKTRLAQEAVVHAERRGFATGFGTALAESVIPYHPWKEALEGLGLGHVLNEHPPPKLLGLYIVTGEGAIVAKVEREADGPLAATTQHLARLSNGVRDQRTRNAGEGPFSFHDLGLHRAIMHRADGFGLAAIIEGREDEALLSDLKSLVGELERSTGKSLGRGKASDAVLAIPESILRRLMETGKYEGIDYVRGDAKLRRDRLFDYVALGISRKSEVQPQLLALDDLQWADPTSLALLQYVARNVNGSHVLIVGTYRVEEAGLRPHLREALAAMEKERLPAGFLLSGLPREEMRHLAEVFLGPHALPGNLLDDLWRETQGYPLFIREVLRGLQEDGAIHARGATKRLAMPIGRLDIPVRVREAIRVRLDKLPGYERRLLDAAAACGTRFSTALLAKVAGEEEGKVLPGLHTLVRLHGLLRVAENGFAFDHPALREVAYDQLPQDVRQSYHTKAAEWLDLVGGPIEDTAEHYYRARDPRAVRKLREAAEAAALRYANEEAARLVQEALDLAPDDAELWAELGSICELTGEYSTGLKSFNRALELVREPSKRAALLAGVANISSAKGDFKASIETCRQALVLVDAANSREEALVLRDLAYALHCQGNYEMARESANKGLRIAEHIGDDALAGSLRGEIGASHEWQGQYDKALEFYATSLRGAEKRDDLRQCASILNNMGNVELDRAAYEQALRFYEKSLAFYERIGNLGGIGVVAGNIGAVHFDRGSYQMGLDFMQRALKMAKSLGNVKNAALAMANMAGVYSCTGDYRKALDLGGEAVAMMEKVGHPAGLSQALITLCDVHLELGDCGQATMLLARSRDIVESIGARWELPSIFLMMARVHLAKKEVDHALDLGERGLAVGRQMKLEREVASARLVLGLAYREKGQTEKAIENIESGLRTCTEIGDILGAGESHYELGITLRQLGEVSNANEHLRKAEAIFAEIGAFPRLEKARDALRTLEGKQTGRNSSSKDRATREGDSPTPEG